jgi:alpha-tubulin suppressor-like RCC1 family protein
MKTKRNLIQISMLCAVLLQALTSEAQPVTQIAGGGAHSLFLKGDGSLWGMGANYDGQLGDGTYNNTNKPEQIVSSNITAIAAGVLHSLFLKSDGSLWGMGDNELGQLGDGTYTTNAPYGINQPEQIVTSNVTAIAAGNAHSLFLKSDGSLWGMGFNEFGQLGDSTFNNTDLPEMIVCSNVTAIAAGGLHSLFLKSDGSLWGMGWNQYGQLGDGTFNNTNLPEQIVAGDVRAIAAGSDYSFFLKSIGSLWAMGGNTQGQLGDSSYTTNTPFGISHLEQIVAYDQMFGQLLGGTNMQLFFVGWVGTNYALDCSSSLSPPNWIPQLTNPAGYGGALVFTNAPDATTNNFWRIRSVP